MKSPNFAGYSMCRNLVHIDKWEPTPPLCKPFRHGKKCRAEKIGKCDFRHFYSNDAERIKYDKIREKSC